MDAGTGMTILGGAVGSAKLVEKLLGPTADYLGGGLSDLAQKGVNNLAKIFNKALHTLGTRIDEPGTVPPTVLKEILSNGPFCDDDLATSYYAGVLASSRTVTSRDDRGKVMAALVGRLASYEIHAHYVLYTMLKRIYDGHSADCGIEKTMLQMGLYVPGPVFSDAMGYDETERKKASLLAGSAIQGLYREKLIHDDWSFRVGSDPLLSDNYEFVVHPEVWGYVLYLWVHGRGDSHISEFTDPSVSFPLQCEIKITSGYKAANESSFSGY